MKKKSYFEKTHKSFLCLFVIFLLLNGTTFGAMAAWNETESEIPITNTDINQDSPLAENEQESELIENEEEDSEVSEETSVPVEESKAANDKVEVKYDSQPTTIEEVQEWIHLYETTLEESGALSALETKPHWEFIVEEELMPDGYDCQLVDDDEKFGAEYYTFFLIPTQNLNSYWAGDGSEDNPYKIESVDDLLKLAAEVNDGNSYAGEYFVLTNDIDLSNYGNWTPIGSASARALPNPYVYNGKPFSGIFDGSYGGVNHSITGLSTSSGNFRGLFGFIENATIENLTVTTTEGGVNGTRHVGGLVAYARDSTIKNCTVGGTVKGGQVYYYSSGTGGLVGGAENTTILGSSAVNVKVNGNYNVGGLVGIALSGTSIDDSTATGTVSTDGLYVGGLVGHVYLDFTYYPGTSKGVSITNSNADVAITCSANEVGGLIGKIFIEANSTAGFEVTVENCRAKGNITGTGSLSAYYGGLVGVAYAYAKNASIIFKDCSAEGDVTTRYYVVGGLIGYTQGNVTVDSCSASGDVKGPNSIVAEDIGGLIGLTDGVLGTWDGVIIKNSYATGDVYSGKYQAGGFIGEAYAYTKIENSYAAGNVTANDGSELWAGVGGFIGNVAYSGVSIANSYATGSVTSNSAQYAGGFIGNVYYTRFYAAPFYTDSSLMNLTIKNCYATGTVNNNRNSNNKAGFIGRIRSESRVYLTDCYFDTTTAGTTSGIRSGSATSGDLTGVNTEKMINIDTFSSWGVKNNVGGKSEGAGSDGNPWYIDDKTTYPYLYYQYDGHSDNDRNYLLSSVTYTNTSGDTVYLADRADFYPENIASDFKFSVTSGGAAGAYFPYSYQKHPLSKDTATDVSSKNSWTIYSLGSISATDIIAFDGAPVANKISDRSEYVEGDNTTYTYVGDEITYTITVTNYSAQYDWENVVLEDLLPEGLTLIENTVIVNGEAVYEGTSGSSPVYYNYEYDIGTNRYMLTIHLNNLNKYDSENNVHDKAVVEFTVLAGKDAASAFPLDDPDNIIANGDNIRNTGIVTGNLYLHVDDESILILEDYEAEFDDKNTDPVYPMYRIKYDGNDGETLDGKPVYDDDYYLPEDDYYVLSNDDIGFVRRGYTFEGWNTQADGNGDIYLEGAKLNLSNDLTLYAQWKPILGSITIIKKGEDNQLLNGAKFLLERKEIDTTGEVIWTAIKWNGNAWLETTDSYSGETNSEGTLTFGKEDNDNSTLPAGTYRITEVEAPTINNVTYSLLKEPIEVAIPYETTTLNSNGNNEYQEYYENDDGDIVYCYYDLTYEVTNVATFEIPKAGSDMNLSYLYTVAGLVIILVSCSFYIFQRRYKKTLY